MQTFPINMALAIVFSLLPFPSLKLLDYANRGCGDGMCGFFSGLLVIGGLLLGTIIFTVRGQRRAEKPESLLLAPLLLWPLSFVPLFF
ncbi:MAG: hypothetical protein AB7F96_07050 [Beijerinckiaceae bacterium]